MTRRHQDESRSRVQVPIDVADKSRILYYCAKGHVRGDPDRPPDGGRRRGIDSARPGDDPGGVVAAAITVGQRAKERVSCCQFFH